MLYNIYLCCLAIGVIYTVATTIISGLVSAADLSFDVDFGLETDFDLHLPIKPFTIMVFITVFGGSGLIFYSLLEAWFSFLLALFCAYAISKLMYHTVYVSLVKAQSRTKSVRDAIGVEATVLETIPAQGIGRISYVVNKNILSAAAKSQNSNNNGYKKNSKVIITDIKDNIYYVSEKYSEEKSYDSTQNKN